MRYGYCLNLQFLEGDATSRAIFDAVAKAGFDYVELPFSALSALTPQKLEELKKALAIIPCRACNLFFPPSLTLVGENMDIAGIRAYLEKMLPLAAEMGIENLVFGNGGARKIPKGATRESIWANLRIIVEAMDEYAAKSGITISVEPLNTTETDIINSYSEAVNLTNGLRNVATMIDSYHVSMENQTYDDMLKNPAALKHLHTAYPTGRMTPQPTDDMSLYAEFIKTVKQIGYNDKISIEGGLKATDPEGIKAEIKSALETLKSLI